MPLFRLSDWPLALKMGLAPTLAAVVLIGVAVSGALVREQTMDVVQEVVDTDLPATLEFTYVARRIGEAKGELYRLLTFQAAAIDVETIPEHFASLLAELDAISTEVDTFIQQSSEDEQRAALEGLQQTLEAYRGAVEWVGSMLAIDFDSAASFVVPLSEQYQRMIAALDLAIAGTVADADQRARTGEARATAANRVTAVLTIAAIIVFGTVSIIMVVGTRRSISIIAGATKSLAEGDRRIDLRKLQRRDELGALVRPLEVFRDNQERLEAMRAEQEAMRRQADEDRRATLERLAQGFEKSVFAVVRDLTGAVDSMQETSGDMSSRADNARARSLEVADASARSLSNVQTVAGAAEELSASITEIGQQVNRSQTIAQEAVDLAGSADERVASLAEAASQIGSVVDLINGIAAKTNLLALNATIATVASATEQLSASIAEISKQVDGANSKSSEASGLVDQTARRVDDLKATVDRVGEVVQLIRAISEKTNLLALNATIEAARAGDAGKGFAVVAGEVKALANQTAQATQEISGKITAMQSTTDAAVSEIRGVASVINRISEITTAVAGAVEEQNAATGDIVGSITGAASGVQEAASGISAITDLIGSVGMASDGINTLVTDLSRQTDVLRLEVEQFLATVRTA